LIDLAANEQRVLGFFPVQIKFPELDLGNTDKDAVTNFDEFVF
jgi:hypothetical protein